MTLQLSRALCHIFLGWGLKGREAAEMLAEPLAVRLHKVMKVCLMKQDNRVKAQRVQAHY